MSKLGLFLGAVAVVLVLGGGTWLAISPMQPASKTVRVTLPDASLPH